MMYPLKHQILGPGFYDHLNIRSRTSGPYIVPLHLQTHELKQSAKYSSSDIPMGKCCEGPPTLGGRNASGFSPLCLQRCSPWLQTTLDSNLWAVLPFLLLSWATSEKGTGEYALLGTKNFLLPALTLRTDTISFILGSWLFWQHNSPNKFISFLVPTASQATPFKTCLSFSSLPWRLC